MTEPTTDLPGEHIALDRSGHELTVHLSGEIDAAVAQPIADRVLAEQQPDDQQVWLDTSAVTFCDSSGIGMFIRLHQAIEGQGISFALRAPSPCVQQLLEMTGLTETLEIHPG
ncbi:MAG: antirepressor [Ilumatobacteraceae bacterium]|nr:antirepressor [Ilumatobacteraceae bacterium]